ncbi:hypothetical protein WOLCODRAFT_132876 [Wolfiporia cocos MD-104 SS10]|uniref:Hemerythrin-like domain-containing protein n=1 Tax=Wolfiporia cocos (strain MD-104) TaxID=742152 RepID=A0A2H3K5E9_WOLCO|nr:hypothetical protein WOLCODRAFT_132876 [Wolfiporia cocos MD-104 SS10]
MYLRSASQLVKHLTMHHTIEEQYIFPVLATRMPAFRQGEAHISAHEQIHHGLDKLSALLAKWTVSPSTYNPSEMRACLDDWREVLFMHLDQEVDDLLGENMKKYWKLEEMDSMPL